MDDQVSYFDMEFEQYTLDKKILRELLIDEILLYQNKDARKFYSETKKNNPNGVLEVIY